MFVGASVIISKRYGAQGEDHEFFESLWNEDDPEVVEQVLHNLGLLGYYNPLYTSRFGTADSSFYFGSMSGSVLSGEHKRGQEDRPDAPTPPPSVLEEEEKEPEKTREIWAAYSRVDVDGEEYMYEGRAVAGYDLQRAGIIGGINRQFDATLSGGLFFALTAPEIESLAKVAALSKSFVNTRMEMTDFQFAGHIEKVFADNWELALYVGGGHQSMEWERRVQLGNFAETYRADSTGNTLIGTAYFAYRYDVTDNWTLRPTLGFDSEHAWLYNFTESGCNAERKDVDYADWFLGQRLHYANSYYNRNTARVGLSTSINGTQGFAGLSGRVFYATQLGGDAAPQLTVTSDALGDINVDSHAMGGESVTVGGGGYLHLNQAKTFTAESDVNATWYKNASTLNVTGGVSYRY